MEANEWVNSQPYGARMLAILPCSPLFSLHSPARHWFAVIIVMGRPAAGRRGCTWDGHSPARGPALPSGVRWRLSVP